MSDQLRLMAVHAHPDDESSKGAATMARYVAEGVDVHVVTCTGGERGSVLNPRLAHDEQVLANLPAIRRREMATAREILGVRQDWLGWVDSGLPEGDPLPPLPEGCFALMDVEQAAEPLVRLIRSFRPQVMTTYDENGGYPHPDHIMCHRISVHAYEAAGDPARYPDAGEPWQPSKLYYNQTFTKARTTALHEAILAAGNESPYGEWLERWEDHEERTITTRVPCADYFSVRDRALLAHATQVDPDGSWFACPLEVQKKIWPTEDFELARSELPWPADGEIEDDLFAGIRDAAVAPQPQSAGPGLVTALLATTAAVAAESLLAVEDEKVTPGVLGFLVVAALAVATWFLIRSMRRHLGRVDFVEEPAPTKGSGPTEDTRPGPTDGSDAGPTDAAPTR